MSTKDEHSMFSGKLLKVFPPPHFLQMSAVGFDITDNSVRFLELTKPKENKRIKCFGNYEIPEKVISEGKIIDLGKLIKVLSLVKKENNINFINASLPEEQAYLFQATISIAELGKNEIRNLLEIKLEENVPFSSKDLVFDYEIIREHKDKKEIDVNITAFQVSIVNDYVSAFRGAGIIPISFEIEAQSIARAIIPKDDLKTYMIVDFGKLRTGIAIVSGGILRFTSTISVGGDTLTVAVRKHFNVDKEEADKIKNEKGFARYKENEDLFETLMTTVSVLKDEINKHFLYWNSKEDHDGKVDEIKKIILCGGSANLAGLPEYLSVNLDVPVEIANVWANAFSLEDFIPEIEHRHSLAYSTSIGLALR